MGNLVQQVARVLHSRDFCSSYMLRWLNCPSDEEQALLLIERLRLYGLAIVNVNEHDSRVRADERDKIWNAIVHTDNPNIDGYAQAAFKKMLERP